MICGLGSLLGAQTCLGPGSLNQLLLPTSALSVASCFPSPSGIHGRVGVSKHDVDFALSGESQA